MISPESTDDLESRLLSRVRANLRVAWRDANPDDSSLHWSGLFNESYRRLSQAADWSKFRRNGLSAGLDDTARVEELTPQEAQLLQAEFRELTSRVGRSTVDELMEVDVGGPTVVEIDGTLVNTHDLQLVHYATKLSALTGQPSGKIDVLEIGGGYGGLAAKLKVLLPQACITIVDLPEANALQTYYLGRLFPRSHFWLYEDYLEAGKKVSQQAEFQLLPSQCAASLPSLSFDLVINTRSMMEMTPSVIASYFTMIHRVTRVGGSFYCVNRYSKRLGDTDINLKDYPFDDRWQVARTEASWRQPWIHELSLHRLGEGVSCDLARVLKGLPPYRVRDLLDGQPLRKLLLIVAGRSFVQPSLSQRLRSAVRTAISRALRRIRGAFV